MNKRQAKKEACFRAAMTIENALSGDWETLDKYGDDRIKVEQALGDLIEELTRRSA